MAGELGARGDSAMQIIKRFTIYGLLIFFISALAGLGFHTAETGIQSLVGSDMPPQTIHLKQNDQALEVTVLGKQVVQPKLTLGDEWSRRLESTKNGVGDIVDRLSYDTGKTLQVITRRIMEWIGAHLSDLIEKAVAS